MVERRFARSIGSLDSLFTFLDSFMTASGVGADDAFDLRLAAEELFTNMVKYHPESTESVLLRLERIGTSVRMTLQDFDVDAWDITKAPGVEVYAPLEERKPGGLGLHLVRRIADELRYEHHDRSTIITLIKRVGP